MWVSIGRWCTLTDVLRTLCRILFKEGRAFGMMIRSIRTVATASLLCLHTGWGAYFFIILSGARLSPLATAATSDLLYQREEVTKTLTRTSSKCYYLRIRRNTRYYFQLECSVHMQNYMRKFPELRSFLAQTKSTKLSLQLSSVNYSSKRMMADKSILQSNWDSY